MAETEQFYLVTPTRATSPARSRSWPARSTARRLTVAALNARRYIDVTFTSLDGTPIHKASIEDAAPEFKLSGTGLRDVDARRHRLRRSWSACRC